MNQESWERDVAPLPAEVNGSPMAVRPKRFSTGSLGWYHSGKIEIDGLRVQVTVSVIVIGSKPQGPGDTVPKPVDPQIPPDNGSIKPRVGFGGKPRRMVKDALGNPIIDVKGPLPT